MAMLGLVKPLQPVDLGGTFNFYNLANHLLFYL